MKHKVSELEGVLLDAAVAKAEGYGPPVLFEADALGEGEAAAMWFPHPSSPPFPVSDWRPSSAWVQGGPIVEREQITVVASTGYSEPLFWAAKCGAFSHYIDEPLYSGRNPASAWDGDGHTPLIAAMRAYVASKFGDEVDLA